jgi:hypothetical protein
MTVQQTTHGSDEVLSVDGVSVRLSGREVLHDVRFTLAGASSPG